uniref:Uncharacterized protein n=1 Tax=Timema bartmani TaxID=61472 RepID=A0A7R9F5Q4_9NEOP|nr:unnamed protein product [Timema bartmani]
MCLSLFYFSRRGLLYVTPFFPYPVKNPTAAPITPFPPPINLIWAGVREFLCQPHPSPRVHHAFSSRNFVNHSGVLTSPKHSMLYFFHHYELPVILQQAQLQQLLIRTQHGPQGQQGAEAPPAAPPPAPESPNSTSDGATQTVVASTEPSIGAGASSTPLSGNVASSSVESGNVASSSVESGNVASCSVESGNLSSLLVGAINVASPPTLESGNVAWPPTLESGTVATPLTLASGDNNVAPSTLENGAVASPSTLASCDASSPGLGLHPDIDNEAVVSTSSALDEVTSFPSSAP